MAKKEDIQEAGKTAAGGQVHKPDENQGLATAEIETVEDLEACYPKLVSEIRDDVVEQIGKCPVQKVKANLPELYQRIIMEVQGKSGPNLNVPGFLLEIDDPFAEGTLQTYQNLKRIDGLRLPYVLPYKDKMTKQALENYILRAEGSCDIKRAEIVREAMKKIK